MYAGGTRDHPRVRGADSPRRLTTPELWGSAPRARGRRRARRPPGLGRADHPRVRGADQPLQRHPLSHLGSSPRARGRRPEPVRDLRAGGIIPACAGPTWSRPSARLRPGDHPRVRGADSCPLCANQLALGSSPRARGRRRADRRRNILRGIIPACAGPTCHRTTSRPSAADHPRVRGADRDAGRQIECVGGSSPRARGRPAPPRPDCGGLGIIPACAGPTPVVWPPTPPTGDHPRVRGADAY